MDFGSVHIEQNELSSFLINIKSPDNSTQILLCISDLEPQEISKKKSQINHLKKLLYYIHFTIFFPLI